MNLDHLCDFKNGKCRAMRAGKNLCCGICTHLSSKGCTTENIFCNSWWCNTALKVATKEEKDYIEQQKKDALNTTGLSYPRYFKSKENINELIKSK